MKALGYVRVSTAEQESDGVSLAAQKHAISEEVMRRGWALSELAGDTSTGRSMKNRPQLERALRELDSGAYGALVVARLDRLARSTGDFASILDRSHRRGWALVMIDPAVDTTTPYGRALAGVAAVFAQLESELISQRTKEGLAAAEREGRWHPPKPEIPPRIERRIVRAREDGDSLGKIAADLTLAGVKTARGGTWRRSTVVRVLERAARSK